MRGFLKLPGMFRQKMLLGKSENTFPEIQKGPRKTEGLF
jgi:hypothetical protein